MENIPVRNSLINGEKAYTIGEWNGQIPCHWYSSKMILKPFDTENSSSKFKTKNSKKKK